MLHSMTRHAITSKTKRNHSRHTAKGLGLEWHIVSIPCNKNFVATKKSNDALIMGIFRPEKPQPFSWRGSNKLLLRSNNSNGPTKNTKIVWNSMNQKKTFRKNEHRAWHFQNLQHFGIKISYVSVSGICNILHLRISYFSVLAGFLDLESFICSIFATFPTLNLDFISCSILEHVQSQISYLQGTCSIPKETPGVHLAWWLHHMRHNLLVGMLDTKTTLHWLCEVESRYLWNILALESVFYCDVVMDCWLVLAVQGWTQKMLFWGRAGCGAHGVEPHVGCRKSRYFWNILPLESFKKHVWIQLSFGMVFAPFGF